MHLRKRATSHQLPPAPSVVNPTGRFEGNDGSWSTFSINVNSDEKGENGQNFRVLISTSSPLTLVPQQTGWCNTDCAERRGVGQFNGRPSLGVQDANSWEQAGFYSIPLPYWYPDTFLNTTNHTLGGTWGLTNVGLGESSSDSDVLVDRYVAKYTFDSGDFFMGSFGLAAGSVGPTGGDQATFLSQYNVDNGIASVSYGYAAGAYYRK